MFVRHEKIKTAGFYFLHVFAVFFILFFALRLWNYDLYVPFAYEGDSLWSLTLVKGIIQNGWTYRIPQLSAPYELYPCAFAAFLTFDWFLIKFFALFTSNAGLVLNLYWLTTFLMTSLSAFLCLRLLNINKWLASSVGILYAFLPYAFLRNLSHFALLYYAVPPLSLLAIYLSHGLKTENDSAIRKIGYAACVVQGLSYIYFSFFAVILFFVAGVIGYFRTRSWKSLTAAFLPIALVSIVSFCNLIPAFYIWNKQGKPNNLDYKNVNEAELYGAKLRKMIAPHPHNALPFLSQWGKKDWHAHFPYENENTYARLGMYGAVGLLFLFAVLVLWQDKNSNPSWLWIQRIANLNLISFLLITVGGLGALINLLTVPDIRCYNRFSVFIAFFSMAGLSLLFQEWIRHCQKSWKQGFIIGAIVVFMGISLYDQLLEKTILSGRYETDKKEYYHDTKIVAMFEKHLAPGTKVYQLPATTFPPDCPREKMGPYSHARAYLWSQNLSWSWPPFSIVYDTWQSKIESLQGEEWMKAIVLSDFEAIWIDRYGYKDNGESLIQALSTAGAQRILENESERYALFDLRDFKKTFLQKIGEEEYKRQSDLLLNSIVLQWKSGFYPAETDHQGKEFRWAKKKCLLHLYNPSQKNKKYQISFSIRSSGDGYVEIKASAEKHKWSCSPNDTPVSVELEIPGGSLQKIEFRNRVPRAYFPGNSRNLYVRISNFKIIEMP